MDAARREEILGAYALHASIFDEVARRRERAAALFGRGSGPAHDPQQPARLGLGGTDTSFDLLKERMTKRTREVLSLVAEGQTNDEIARYLRISPETAKDHVKRMLAVLDARNRAHAVATAFRLGLLAMPEADLALAGGQQPRAIASE